MSQRPRLHRHQWEGVYTADFTLDGVRRRCWGLGQALAARNWSCLVVHDTRFLAGQFARYAYHLLQIQGVRAGLCPTHAPFPAVVLALEQRRADCALMISGGNRPHWSNGLIVLAPTPDRLLVDVIPPEGAAPLPFPPPPLDAVDQTQVDLRSPYLEALRTLVDIDLIRRSTLTVFVDPMNGTTSGYIPTIIGEGAQTKAIEINREIDPLFGRQPPQPSETGVARLRKLVKESDSHLGVALSADGRAIGVTDNTGELVKPVDLGLLLAQYLVRQHRQRGLVVVPATDDDSSRLRKWEDATGLKVEAVPDPAARINELVAQDRASMLAGITAGGELTLGRSSSSPDATLAALLLIELVARTGGKLRAQLEDLWGRMSGQ